MFISIFLIDLRWVSVLLPGPEEVRSYHYGDVVCAHFGEVRVQRELLKKRHEEPEINSEVL